MQSQFSEFLARKSCTSFISSLTPVALASSLKLAVSVASEVASKNQIFENLSSSIFSIRRQNDVRPSYLEEFSDTNLRTVCVFPDPPFATRVTTHCPVADENIAESLLSISSRPTKYWLGDGHLSTSEIDKT